MSTFLRNAANSVIDILSFDSEVRRLVNILNRKLEQHEDAAPLKSHPMGFEREIGKRRIRIATAYINIVRQLESEKFEERLQALETLVRESLHAKNVDMPLNTARLQAALMKEVVKSKGHLRNQLEFMTEFTRASYGQPNVIRELLKRMMMIEVPETGKKLCEMDLGWDGHVHDNLSEGRKTPSQVMLDAFIKGISEVTLAYYDFADTRIIREALGAGEILGVRVRIGIEFSTGKSGSREHFMELLPHFTRVEEFIDFFAKAELHKFSEGLKENAHLREETIKRMLVSFNRTKLAELNVGVSTLDSLTLQPLDWESLKSIVLEGQASRMHLGEMLYRQFKPILHRRVLALKTQYETVMEEVKQQRKSRTDLKAISCLYEATRRKYEELTPESLRLDFFEDRAAFDYDSAFDSKEEILCTLVKAGGETIYIHPLVVGLPRAITTIIKNAQYLMQVETFNMRDSINRNPLEYHMLNHFVELINTGSYEELKKFLERCHVSAVSEIEIKAAFNHFHVTPLLTRCGSDSTGRDPRVPGMGFIRLNAIPEKSSRQFFLKTHTELPFDVDLTLGRAPEDYSRAEEATTKDIIISLGKTSEFRKNRVGDEESLTQISARCFLRYLNPTLKNLMKVGIGAVPAYLGFTRIGVGFTEAFAAFAAFAAPYLVGEARHTLALFGLTFTLIWFGVTFVRNVLADLTSTSGLDPREWKYSDINFENASNSLFWTGFSVPLLSIANVLFDFTVKGALAVTNDFILRWGKFFFLAFTNGAYLYAHNSLRGFVKSVKRMNFFRSILSFPFASAFSYVLDTMSVMFIPKVVQTKFWSDAVAGIIEGTSKYRLIEKLRRRDFDELLPLLDSPERGKRAVAMLDILYIWAKRQRGESVLHHILTHNREVLDKLFHLYTDEGTMEEMVDIVVTHFEGDDAVALTKVIGTWYPRLQTWLIRLHRSCSHGEEGAQDKKMDVLCSEDRGK